MIIEEIRKKYLFIFYLIELQSDILISVLKRDNNTIFDLKLDDENWTIWVSK